MIRADIGEVQKGDIVRFASFALRVDHEPRRVGPELAWIELTGRTNRDGCPLVTRRYMIGQHTVTIERDTHEAQS